MAEYSAQSARDYSRQQNGNIYNYYYGNIYRASSRPPLAHNFRNPKLGPDHLEETQRLNTNYKFDGPPPSSDRAKDVSPYHGKMTGPERSGTKLQNGAELRTPANIASRPKERSPPIPSADVPSASSAVNLDTGIKTSQDSGTAGQANAQPPSCGRIGDQRAPRVERRIEQAISHPKPGDGWKRSVKDKIQIDDKQPQPDTRRSREPLSASERKKLNEHLWDAARIGDNERVTRLIQEGASIHAENGKAYNALYIAARAGKVDTALILLQAGAEPNRWTGKGTYALWTAASQGSAELIQVLMKAGANVDITFVAGGETALHEEAKRGHQAGVIALIDGGANVNARTLSRTTPLHLAAEGGHTDVVNMLVRAGANVDSKTRRRTTPLHLAAEKGRTDVVNALVQAGADINCLNIDGFSPFLLCHFPETERALLSAGAIVDSHPFIQAAAKIRKWLLGDV